ncbi:hypothetical protein DSM03_101808 [Leeuwenhoekiella aestuarii]|uniref:Uncharacterized protein n=1 Tax=Leeuwenhoekiella aestuarii TaxID=2249426 RepID=A0A4Q0P1L4_9FLAO|nr:hypothetical protein [Leeuwenhoekiella aestuarii]RXG18129.1 hypothetical protein DSM04_101317 [Leeuwenhoekiella aestuarii]RXG19434.1 hypothetical protein DSM03_101808 [Leeuwenhoekiella aestuarii]
MNVLSDENLSFDNFIINNQSLPGNYKFSPDHTSWSDSFNKHINSNWVQFFIGGSSLTYYPSSRSGYVTVQMLNPTSRASLLLHAGEKYDRSDGFRPLSTINQIFWFDIKIE